jgi:hypothetical protein
MSNLSEELINKIMMYVPHPCADMIRDCITEDNDIKFYSRTKESNNPNIFKPIVFIFDCETSLFNEKRYESQVVERNILNKIQKI